MRLKLNSRLLLLCFGLISCSEDKSDQTEIDTWMNSPQIQLVQSDNLMSHTSLKPDTEISQNDFIIFEPKGAVAIDALSECWLSNNRFVQRDETIPFKIKNSILDLLPIEAIKNSQIPISCKIGLRFHNENGSTRRRFIGPINIQIKETENRISIENPKQTYAFYELNDIKFKGLDSPGQLAVVCPDSSQQSRFQNIAELQLESLFNENDFGSSPFQECYVSARDSENRAFFGPDIQIVFANSSQEVTYISRLGDAENHYLSHERVLSIVIVNRTNRLAQYRLKKSPKSIVVRFIANNGGAHITSNHHPRSMEYKFELPSSASSFDTDSHHYISLQPGERVIIEAFASFGVGCGSAAELAGFDFGFYPDDSAWVERANIPIHQKDELSFKTTSRYDAIFINAFTVSGQNRLPSYIPWRKSRFEKGVVQGTLPEQFRCYN